MIASDDAAIRAPAKPCAARAPISSPRSDHPPLPEVICRAPSEQQKAGEGNRIRVDHPLQIGRREAKARLDRWQRHVDDAQVEDDHELGDAADRQ
jgi:hypothetical protein